MVNTGQASCHYVIHEMVTRVIQFFFSNSHLNLVNVLQEQRLHDTLETLKLFGDHDLFTTGFTLESHVDIRESVEVLDNPLNLRQSNDPIVLCVVLFGNQGESLAVEDVDSAPAATKGGGFILRHSSQLLPLIKFPAHEKTKTQDIARLCAKIETAFLGSFGTPANLHKVISGPTVVWLSEEQSATGESSTVQVISRANHGLDHVQIWDVLCDRHDSCCANHFGNRRFAVMVCMIITKQTNEDLLKVDVRVRAARSIIHSVRRNGRFLARTKRNTWKDIGDNLAIRWASLILKTTVINAIAAKTKKAGDIGSITDDVKDVEFSSPDDK
eukprot:CAMPEP_0116556588 /NCGR_PEP_ID=MMETSP0397-20121206/8777_1 /TAXON_ID=216820 /ORGANISM="Cyclophora tenuis, Strain ECT3854" /LENGTH=327 /DNA_ID=CAMNT_0004081969 /DNA_START=296 /DNA_END=1279 /DNA_ORIENTATION=-